MRVLILPLFTIVQAALLQGWDYYTRDESEYHFKPLGAAAVIEYPLVLPGCFCYHPRFRSLDLLNLYLDNSPALTLALIDAQTLARTKGSIVQIIFKVDTSELNAYFDAFVSHWTVPQEKERLPSLIGFTEQILDHEGIITCLLQTGTLIGFFETWMGMKYSVMTEQPINQLFDKSKPGPKWKVLLEDHSIGTEIIAEVTYLNHLYNPIVLASLRPKKAKIIVERSDFSLSHSHDRFELTVDSAYGPRSFWFALEALHDDLEVFGARPWLGLEMALRIELDTVSPSLSKICLYFGTNAISKIDVQRIFSGLPYFAFIVDTFYQPQQREISSYKIDSCYGIVNNPLASILIDGEMNSARTFTFPHIAAKKLKDTGHTLQIHRKNSFVGTNIFVFCYTFSCSSIASLITRFWVDFINNKRLPEFVNHISHYTFGREEDIGKNVLLIQLPNAYATEFTLDSLEILVYLFFRYCGVESEHPKRFSNYNSDSKNEVTVSNIDLSNITFGLYHFDMKWYGVKCSSSDDWLPTSIKKNQKNNGGLKGTASSTKTETEVKVSVAVPKPMVFPRLRPVLPAPPPTTETASSWDEFYSELDD